jgi:hypothetical protein
MPGLFLFLPMRTFLDSVLDDFDGWRTRPSECTFVLPSKRAGFFLRNLMSSRTRTTLFAPRIFSIEGFVEEISGLRYASSSRMLFSLYEASLNEKGLENESFHDFSRWGRILLQDFNEIDRYLVDPDRFFSYLGSLQEIRHWTPDGSSTPLIEKQVRFWKSLYPIYRRFREGLEREGLGYQGQVYRKAVETLGEYLNSNASTHFVFAGFNALNTAEETIIREILENGKADIFWDADQHYVDNAVHDAGFFLRKHFETWKTFQNVPPRGVGRYLHTQKNIQITGIPKSIAQAKYAGGLIGNLLRENPEGLGNTALILGDENLLNPILHSLPEELPGVNITMGYPLKDSVPAHLFGVLFQLFEGLPQRRIPSKKVLTLLAHPYLQDWLSSLGMDSAGTRERLIRENAITLATKDFERYGFAGPLINLLSPDPPPGPAEVLARLTGLLEELQEVFLRSGDPVPLEFLRHFHLLFNQLSELNQTYPFLSDIRTLYMLYQQLLEEDTLDFEGEPLEGLQVMGMLESRCLDFETVVITSVNEGILPAGKSNSSFIPYEVKREFGLPTFKEKDAVYTYHFYRLLHRAKNIYLCYNTEPDVLAGGEPSRFIHQLRTDSDLFGTLTDALAAPESGIAPALSRTVPKSAALLDQLARKASSGFSPTSLSRYIEDPLEFYRKTILGIEDAVALEETIAANTFGNVIHETLEALYLPCVGELLTPAHLYEMKKQGPGALSQAFEKHYLKGGAARGKNLIALSVMQRYIDLFLEFETGRVRAHEVRILGVEEKLTRELPDIPGCAGPVRIKGTVDRIETVDGELQIIDYKTGRVEPAHLRVTDWAALGGDAKKAKAFQVLCYAWLKQGDLSGLDPHFRAGVFSFKNIQSGIQWFGLKSAGNRQDEIITDEVLGEFQGVLTSLVTELFDPEIPIMPPPTAPRLL